jgi:hypothetical protein
MSSTCSRCGGVRLSRRCIHGCDGEKPGDVAATQRKRRREAKKQPDRIDWRRVERIMELSVRGYTPTSDESRLLERTYRQAPGEYSRRHRRIKEEAVRDMMCRHLESGRR